MELYSAFARRNVESAGLSPCRVLEVFRLGLGADGNHAKKDKRDHLDRTSVLTQDQACAKDRPGDSRIDIGLEEPGQIGLQSQQFDCEENIEQARENRYDQEGQEEIEIRMQNQIEGPDNGEGGVAEDNGRNRFVRFVETVTIVKKPPEHQQNVDSQKVTNGIESRE